MLVALLVWYFGFVTVVTQTGVRLPLLVELEGVKSRWGAAVLVVHIGMPRCG